MKKIKMLGKRFGKLIVKEECGKNSDKRILWRCVCDCGKEKVVSGKLLRSGGTRSCGCLVSGNNKTHGKSNHPLYTVWWGMRLRCNYPNNVNYKNYGARGVSISEEWKDFMVFYRWANRNGWKKGLQIDRINTFGHYSPNNCRFVERVVNCQNRRNSYMWKIQGKLFTSSTDAAKYFGVCIPTIYRWCNGYIQNGKYCYKPKKNCIKIKKYKGVNLPLE